MYYLNLYNLFYLYLYTFICFMATLGSQLKVKEFVFEMGKSISPSYAFD